jgi:hypothetical protein
MPTPPEPLYPDLSELQEETRVCKKCGVPQPLSNFRSVIKRATVCLPCQAKYHREWVIRKKDEHAQRALAADPSQFRTCSKCGVPKPLSEFYRNKTSLEGYHTACKECANKKSREWTDNNRERRNESIRKNPNTKIKNKIWREANKEYSSKSGKEWRAMNPEHVRHKHIEKRFRNYGVTPEWYDEQLLLQGGGCGICGSKDPKNKYNTFHVDHYHGCCSKSCHACDNCRRGLLCGPCNTSLGILEKVDWKRKAIAYLNKYSKKPAVDPDQGSLFDF